jgi:hypothetical protein
VRLWTVRTARELASARWPLRASERHVDPYMLPAYLWMGGQLARRVGPAPRGVRVPVWFWLRKPDLRERGHLPRGTRGVLLGLELPDARVLISDFSRFETVLNRGYVARGKADDARFARAAEDLDWPYTPALRKQVEQSWERVFTMAPRERDARYWGAPGRAPRQAVAWEIARADVVSERSFTAR